MRFARLLLLAALGCALLVPATAEARRHRRVRKPREHHFSGYLPSVPIVRLDGRKLSPSEVDTIVVRQMREANVPGLGIAIVHEGRVAYLKAYGLRDRDAGLPMSDRTVLPAGSLSATVVAITAVELADAGVLPLDRPLADSLPVLHADGGPFAGLGADPRARAITPRLLLSHRSGLAGDPGGPWKMQDAPGARFAWEQGDEVLLQAAMEGANGDSLGPMVERRVFGPLGMWRSSLQWNPHFEDDAATGYDAQGHAVPIAKPAVPDAAGSLCTTLADYSRILAELLGNSILPPRVVDTLLTRQVDVPPATGAVAAGPGYALGWGLVRTPRGEAFFADGRGPGVRHWAVGFRGQRDGLLVMSNAESAERILGALSEQLLGDAWTPVAGRDWAAPAGTH
jgi:CubicO group peptidase (beta-lactamase class C family)